MVFVYKESPDVDFIIKLREIANRIKKKKNKSILKNTSKKIWS